MHLLLSIFLSKVKADLSLADTTKAGDHESLLYRLYSDRNRRQAGFLKSLADISTSSKLSTDSMRNNVMLILDGCTSYYERANKSISLVYRKKFDE